MMQATDRLIARSVVLLRRFMCVSLAIFGSVFVSAADAKELFVIQAESQDSAPKYLFSSPERRGICGDIYERLAKRVVSDGIMISSANEGTPIKRILHNLEVGKSHMYCGAGRNKRREALFHFSDKPVYRVANIVVSHIEDSALPKSFDDLRNLGGTIGARFGTASSAYLKAIDGLNVNDTLKDVASALKMVEHKRFRFYFYHDISLLYQLSTAYPALKAHPTPLRRYGHWMIYSKSLPSPIRRKIDHHLDAMRASGEIDAILATYRPKGYVARQ